MKTQLPSKSVICFHPPNAPQSDRTRWTPPLASSVATLLALSFAQPAKAATVTWTGGGDGSWSTPASWSPSGAPANGSVLVFGGSSAAFTTSTNTISSGSFAGFLFTYDGSAGKTAGFTLSGNALTLSGSIVTTNVSAGSGITDTIGLPVTLAAGTLQVSTGFAHNLALGGNLDGSSALTKTGVGLLKLSGTNSYTGVTSANAGVLQFTGTSALYGGDASQWTSTNLVAASGATMAFNVGGAGQFTTGHLDTILAGTGIASGAILGIDTTNNTGALSYTPGGLSNRGIAKLGSGQWTFGGAVSSAPVVVDSGTLTLSQDNPNVTSLTLGATPISPNSGTLDLTNANLASASLAARANSTGTNVIMIGAGKTLTTNGNVSAGADAATGVVTKLAVTGSGGTWNVVNSGGTFLAGVSSSGANYDSVTVDLSGLGTFSANLGSTGLFRVGNLSANSTAGSACTVTLASSSNTITSGTLYVGVVAYEQGTHTLKLGAGSNSLNVNTLAVGPNGNFRNAGSLMFNSGSGSVVIRAANGTGPAALTLTSGAVSTAGGANTSSAFDVTGHNADLLFSTVDMMDISSAGKAYAATFSFDTGTLTATNVKIGTVTGAASVNIPSATVNIGSGAGNYVNTATLGAVTLANNTSTATGSGISGFLNISGTNTTASFSSLSIGSLAAASGSGTATAAVTISGGAVTGSNGITIATKSGANTGAVSGTLALNGGSLSVGGNIIGGGGASVLSLNGGLLNMNGYSIGVSGSTVTTLNFLSGTLQNVSEIDAGTGLAKTGAGTLTLAGNNTYTGTTTLSSGTLSISSDANLNGANSPLVFGGGALQVTGTSLTALNVGRTTTFGAGANIGFSITDSANSFTVSQTLNQGTGGLSKSGSGTLVVTGSNTYTGTTTISSGTLQIGDGVTDGSVASSSGIVNNAVLAYNLVGVQSYANTISGAGAVTKSGAGALTLTGSNTYTGATTIGSGKVQIGDGTSGSLAASSTVTVNASGTLAVNLPNGGTLGNTVIDSGVVNELASGTNTISGNLGGVGGFNQSGTGTTILSGSNSFTGPTSVIAGTLQIGAGGVTGWSGSTSGVALASGATLAFSRTDGYGGNFTPVITGSGAIVINSGTLSLVGANTYTGPTTVTSGKLQIGSGSAVGSIGSSSGISLSSTASAIAFNRIDNYGGNFSIVVSGSGNLLLGAGTLVVTGSNTYTGTTTISSGTLQIGDGVTDGSVASSSGIVNNAVLAYNLVGVQSYANTISGAGAVTKSGAGALTLTGSNTYTGATTINSGTLQIGNGTSGSLSGSSAVTVNGGGSFAVNLVNSGTFAGTIYNDGGNVNLLAGGTNTLSGQIYGYATGVLNQSGTGTTILTNNNDFSGVTNITAGVLQLNGQFAANMSTVNVNVANSLAFGVNAASVGALSGSGNVVLLNGTNNVALTTGSNGGSTVYSGVISGGGSLTKTGTGTLTLTNDHSYTGGTTIASGTLVLGVGGTTGFVAGNITDNGTLVLNRADNQTFSGAIGGTGSVIKNGTNTLTLTGVNTFAGGTVISSGSLVLSSTAYALDSSITMNPGTVMTVAGNNNNGLGILGVLNINGATVNNTLTNAKVQNTTVNMTGASWLGGLCSWINSPLNVLSSATTSTFTGTIMIRPDYGSTTLAVNVADGAAATDLLFSGGIQESGLSGNVIKSGSGKMVFTGQTYYSGATEIDGGTLQVGNNGTTGKLASSSALINNGTVVFNRSNAVTQGTDFPTSVSGSGSLIQAGASTLTLNGTNTFTGDTIVSSGTLVLANALALGKSALNYDNQGGSISFGSQTAITLGGLKGAQSIALTNTASAAVSLTVGANNSDTTYTGVLSGSGGALVKTGAGTLTLGGSNTYGGGTTVSGGTLQVGNASALGTGGLTVNNGTLNLGNSSLNVGALSGSAGIITNTVGGTSVLTTALAGGTSTFNGNIANSTGAVVLTQTGSGTLILGGSLTMAGLNANGGVTQIRQSGSIGALSVATGAVVSLAANRDGNRKVLNLSSLAISGFSSGLAQPSGAILNADGLGTSTINFQLSVAGQSLGNAGTTVKTPTESVAPEAVPEPGVLGFFMAGMLGVLGVRRKVRA